MSSHDFLDLLNCKLQFFMGCSYILAVYLSFFLYLIKFLLFIKNIKEVTCFIFKNYVHLQVAKVL